MMKFAAALILGAMTAGAQDAEKKELRYSFKKGETLTFDAYLNTKATLDKVPELLEGTLEKDAVDLKMKGRLTGEVVKVSDGGTATVKGRWLTFKAKGHVIVNDVDVDYDAKRDAGKKPPKKAEPDDGFGGADLLGGIDIAARLLEMTREEVVLTVNPRGEVSRKGEAGLEDQLFNFNGLMGPLPEKKVASGDAWKGERILSLPAGIPVGFKVLSKSTYAGDKKLGDRDCSLIKSTFEVKQAAGGDAADLGIKLDVKGGGEGQMWLSSKDGHPVKSTNTLNVKVVLNLGEDPTGGEDGLNLKITLKMEQGYQFID